jgi:RHS repeat-associated protein
MMNSAHYALGNGYRIYNPLLMRFHKPDSMSPFGAGGLNAYTYCKGDPVNFEDPTGHMPIPKVKKLAEAQVPIVLSPKTLKRRARHQRASRTYHLTKKGQASRQILRNAKAEERSQTAALFSTLQQQAGFKDTYTPYIEHVDMVPPRNMTLSSAIETVDDIRAVYANYFDSDLLLVGHDTIGRETIYTTHFDMLIEAADVVAKKQRGKARHIRDQMKFLKQKHIIKHYQYFPRYAYGDAAGVRGRSLVGL